MKTYLLKISILLGVLAIQSVQAQSMFWLNNRTSGVDAPVFDAYEQPLSGTNYLVELWGGTTSNSLLPTIASYNQQRVIIPFDSGGLFRDRSEFGLLSRGHPAVSSAPPNGWAWLQVRAWDARLGSTYEEVVARGMGGYGESGLFYAQGSNPFAEPPMAPAPLIGLESFSLRVVVPEPSTWALLALGRLGLWWHVQRRR